MKKSALSVARILQKRINKYPGMDCDYHKQKFSTGESGIEVGVSYEDNCFNIFLQESPPVEDESVPQTEDQINDCVLYLLRECGYVATGTIH